MPRRIDLTGQRFGRLTVHRYVLDGRLTGSCMWDCTCDCGTSLLVRSQCLRNGMTKSCGCLLRDTNRSRMTTHGWSKHPLYQLWASMIGRCRDIGHTSYNRYGGRGITVCDRWLQFENFLSDMGQRPSPLHSVDRIDNNGPYSPENCRWSTATEQLLNRRTTRFLTHNGETKTHSEWERQAGITRGSIYNRLKAYGPDTPTDILLSTERFLDRPRGFHGRFTKS